MMSAPLGDLHGAQNSGRGPAGTETSSASRPSPAGTRCAVPGAGPGPGLPWASFSQGPVVRRRRLRSSSSAPGAPFCGAACGAAWRSCRWAPGRALLSAGREGAGTAGPVTRDGRGRRSPGEWALVWGEAGTVVLPGELPAAVSHVLGGCTAPAMPLAASAGKRPSPVRAVPACAGLLTGGFNVCTSPWGVRCSCTWRKGFVSPGCQRLERQNSPAGPLPPTPQKLGADGNASPGVSPALVSLFVA